MSFDSVIAFWRQVQSDATLREKVSPLVELEDEQGWRRTAEVAQEAGFEVTTEELVEVDRVVDFWQLAGSDPALQAKLEAAHALQTPQEALDAIASIGKGSGFDLQQEALAKVTAAMVEGHDALQSDGELSESALAGVVGGAISSGRQTMRPSFKLAVGERWLSKVKGGPGSVGAKP